MQKQKIYTQNIWEHRGMTGEGGWVDKSGTTSQMVDKEFHSCLLLQKAS